MLFNSVHFLLFFPVVVAAYFSIPHRLRWVLLLLASCYFYMVFIPKYILILFILILIDYGAGIAIEASQSRRRAWLLAASLVANIGMLAFFKYFNFVSANLESLVSALGLSYAVPTFRVALPIGLSFHTFQSMAYTIEVYRGNQKAERHLGIYAVYVLFFPQLVAGPIERPRLLRQFHEEHPFDYDRAVSGLKLMTWGMIKKIVIADRLALLVNHVYANPAAHNGAELALATYFFSFQIYCDFSGYSDIAIGAARILGFDLMRNFERPYYAKSVAEFWHRWHISLSTWFRDYLYIPLGGNRVPRWRWWLNLMIVFIVSGLWHGANWTFALWGAMHGFYLLASIWTQGLRARARQWLRLESWPAAHRLLQTAITFHLATAAWIAFRARSVCEAAFIAGRIAHVGAWRWPSDLGLSGRDLAAAFGSLVMLEAVHLIQRRRPGSEWLAERPAWLRYPAYAGALALLLVFGQFNFQSFIYFQF